MADAGRSNGWRYRLGIGFSVGGLVAAGGLFYALGQQIPTAQESAATEARLERIPTQEEFARWTTSIQAALISIERHNAELDQIKRTCCDARFRIRDWEREERRINQRFADMTAKVKLIDEKHSEEMRRLQLQIDRLEGHDTSQGYAP